MGKIDKGVRCSVISCEDEAVKSLPIEKVMAAGLKVRGSKRAYLCKEHYKEFKKATRKERMLDRWRYRI
ncbi:TPA: hypothetical protein EYP70_05500 [Candidatus Bathyarchaeota archaeon]|nr:hypothetical protein [Candidatus Bathyarchaeota archaeon]